MTSEILQDQLADLVLAHSDVATLYSTRPVALEIASRAVSSVIGEHDPVPKVLVSHTADGTTAEVSVGLTGEHSAAAVCRDIHDSIVAELTAAHATPPLTVAVKVSSIA